MRRLLSTGLGLLLLAGTVWGATVTKWILGSTVTALTLSSLNSGVLSTAGSAVDNTVGGGGGDGYLKCAVEGTFTFNASNPTAGSAVSVWFARSIDGSNFDDCGVGNPNVKLPVRSTATTTRKTVEVPCPPQKFKACALNDGTGVQISSGTIKILFFTPEGL